MIRHIILISIALRLLSTAGAQSITEAFPDFIGLEDVRHYEVNPNQAFPNLDKIMQRPDVEGWIKQFQPNNGSVEILQISIYRRAGEVRFVRERLKGQEKYRLYRFANDSIDLISTSEDGKHLWMTQTGVARWLWRYDQSGKFLEKKLFGWSWEKKNGFSTVETLQVRWRTNPNEWGQPRMARD